jgi:hypothetical protein
MLKKGSLLSVSGQLIADEVPVNLSRDIDNSFVGSLELPNTKGLSNGSYLLHLSTGEKGTIIVHRVRSKRVAFVVFGELK